MDELARLRRLEQKGKELLAKAGLLVLLTPHFLEQTYARPGLRWTSFPLLAAKLALLAAGDPGQDHLAIVGNVKVVYLVENTLKDGTPILRLVFKTVMPKEYKHNAFKAAKTILVGEVS